MNYEIYTDGACSKNPGPGGYSFIFVKDDKITYTQKGYSSQTTNNEMELLAIVKALKTLKEKCSALTLDVTVYSDSAYCLNPINLGWLKTWKNKGWKNSSNKPIANLKLWATLYKILYPQRKSKVTINFVKVKGHSGNKYNELADQLAKSIIKEKTNAITTEKANKK